MRWLVRFGYDGTVFAGWARQPGLRTVEGELQAALSRAGLRGGEGSRGLDVASRTDRGVSARANALSLTSDLPAPALLRCLNGFSPEIYFSAAAAISDQFRVRAATRRIYRYFEPSPEGGPVRWRRAARHLVGEIDVRSFGRGIPPDKPCWRTVESIKIARADRGVVVEIRAPSFVWGMVRKMVGALHEYGSGRLPLRRLQAAALGRGGVNLPLAQPEGLVLWDVEYPLAWEYAWIGPNHRQTDWARMVHRGLWTRTQVVRTITGGESKVRRRRSASLTSRVSRTKVS